MRKTMLLPKEILVLHYIDKKEKKNALCKRSYVNLMFMSFLTLSKNPIIYGYFLCLIDFYPKYVYIKWFLNVLDSLPFFSIDFALN